MRCSMKSVLTATILALLLTFAISIPVFAGEGHDDKVTICHWPSGDYDKAHKITISPSAAEHHLADHASDTLAPENPEWACPD